MRALIILALCFSCACTAQQKDPDVMLMEAAAAEIMRLRIQVFEMSVALETIQEQHEAEKRKRLRGMNCAQLGSTLARYDREPFWHEPHAADDLGARYPTLFAEPLQFAHAESAPR